MTIRNHSIDELLADPIAVALMDRDGVRRDDVVTLMRAMRQRLHGRPEARDRRPSGDLDRAA